MAVVKVVDQAKKEIGDIELAPEVFEVPVRPEILNLVVRAQRAAARSGTHMTKNRALITGGGKKPWRQKGTGRARAGSSRSPLWRHGATTFGPQPRSYAFKVNKKVRALALKMALSSKLAGNDLMVLNGIIMDEIKTKKFAAVAKGLGLQKALIVLNEVDNTLTLSARNVPDIKVLMADQLNVYDVLKYPQLVMLQSAVESVQERLK
ncbi:50S ribosomal protein L4 [Desulfocurvibacter africanus]|uniref:Large ribosomal subunit protein uL4 n=2 Tax=Desulfocurvibacter africanus TaxID=873 RepID=F3YWN0_DESAF|nr:50S ribosomal protein L4 [Desulfocurvibacter africanus]EGJ50523.1 ribosomal protein L4/L1e [Desulfocurvibacter africanus subsp. africanus str. Walvis Bay]EMG38233.1 LSU ribosomal protein L4P [Desulfocurvibacter africanus PCS]